MKPSKSLTSVASQQQQQQQQQQQINGQNHRRQPQPPDARMDQRGAPNSAPTSPICRCRVMYLGSSVPHITKDGLQGIQEPLRELYPDKASLNSGNAGIDSWLSVWSNGILIENVDETGREVKRFFKIEALHYCAAVKYVPQVFAASNMNGNATLPLNLAAMPKFLPLDSPHARMQQDCSSSPPIFASILRRTTGVKVLECHAFICKREAAANALVRCCFHAYADTMYAKQIGAELEPVSRQQASAAAGRLNGHNQNGDRNQAGPMSATRRSKSIAALNDVNDSSRENDTQRSAHRDQLDPLCMPVMPRRKSLSTSQPVDNHGEGDTSDSQQPENFDSNNLQNQMKRFSKSMHQLNQPHLAQSFSGFMQDQIQPAEPIFTNNPYASRVPSYPPQNIIDQQQQQQQHLQSINGGTLRSVKSVAANSIASTLLRSKKHAKAMSMAQLNQPNALMPNQPMSFHQFQQNSQHASNTFMTMPPVPPMFMAPSGMNINGSQTMKLPSRHMLQAVPVNFEAMTPKEMKKLLKKSAKYGLNPGKFADTGLPIGMPLSRALPVTMPNMPMPGIFGPATVHGGDPSTFNLHNDLANHPDQNPPPLDVGDFTGTPNEAQPYCLGSRNGPMMDHLDQGPPQPVKSILVKPNPQFLKSKAGKKWLKQQKEFKKLLPAHLDGLPIVFGPPPLDALQTAGPPTTGTQPTLAHPFMPLPPHLVQPAPPAPLQPPPPMTASGLPVLDSNGFYNHHQLYGPSGRASAASTMLRNSPQVMQQHHLLDEQHDYLQRNHIHQQSLYSNPMSIIGQNNSMNAPLPPPPPPMLPPHQQLSGDELYGHQQQRHRRHPSGQYDGQAVRRRGRNHMVEQSVISLGDEEEGEPSEEMDERETENEYGLGYDSQAQQQQQHQSQRNGYYNRMAEGDQAALSGRHEHPTSRPRKATANGYDRTGYQDDYEQINQQVPSSDERNSNSSGIYRRRGHINERAFSYSIRQEASKSSADNSDAEYRNGDLSDAMNYQRNNNNNNHIEYRLGDQRHDAAHYDNPNQGNIYQNKPMMQYYKKHPSQNHQQQPVDELTARLENQLNMKSFAN